MLQIVAIPIGHPKDITLRALDALKSCEALICEDRKEASRFLRDHDIKGKDYHLLNEHTRDEELKDLLDLCKTKHCVLISDCGTPVFCDPGSRLIALCRQSQVKIETLPGASSLMGVLSLSSRPLKDFLFVGFLPANTEQREDYLKQLQKENRSLVIMDTPYRLQKTLDNIEKYFSKREILLAMNLTGENELVLEGTVRMIRPKIPFKKAEFIALIH